MNKLAQRVKDIEPSSTLAITARAKKMRQEGLDVISFAAGEPDFDTPQYIKDAAIKALAEGFTKYTPSSGIPELKKAIQKKFKLDNSLDYEPEQIIVSCGAKHSLFNIIQVLVDKNAEVLIPSPYWVSYLEMVKFAQGKAVILKTDSRNSFKLNAEILSKNITKKTKLLILNSPSNPAGCVYKREELDDIAQICVKNKLWVLSDEIYEKLIYENNKHISIATLNNDIYKLTFVVNGVSKAYSMTGWRIGYLAGDKEAVEATARLQDHSTSNPCSISQKAALAALSSDNGFIDKMRLEFEERRNLMLSELDKIGLDYIKPEGAFYVFLDISKAKIGSWEFCDKFLAEKYVAVIPGAAFGNDNYVRFSFAASMPEIKKGLERLREFISSPR
ncbi:MAG: pyridoxal phosphate-dependent aminotransferase [Candidatus Omnitrophota bacterium]|nr:pyridoxal phosphate-dependent aminotransferase [Candidatus Omnitrophota bacterium]